MIKFNLLIVFIFSFYSTILAQVDFRAGFEKANVLTFNSDLSLQEKLKVHTAYIEKAKNEKDRLKELYGTLFIFYDYLIAQDYPLATKYLLQCEEIAIQSGNLGWQGWVAHRRGIFETTIHEEEKAMASYMHAAELCRVAGDSLCYAESLEQVSAMNSQLDRFDEAEKYFSMALPILEKFGTEKQLSITYNNRGILLSRHNRPLDAIPFFRKALNYFGKASMYREEGKTMNNLADAYRRTGNFDSAVYIFKECLHFNATNNLAENKVSNYQGLYETYKELGKDALALQNYEQYISLQDSLIGSTTKDRIAKLEIEFKKKEDELIIEKNEKKLFETRNMLERALYLIFLLMAVVAVTYWRGKSNGKKAQAKLVENKNNLQNLTNLLIAKNSKIAEMEEQLALAKNITTIEDSHKEDDEYADNIFDQRILTPEDWASFKVYFAKTYPGYLQKLRNSFADITEAEERMFLFIKLNLNNKEAASILGISVDSIKKTRNRLRRRLALSEDISLDDFIRGFGG